MHIPAFLVIVLRKIVQRWFLIENRTIIKRDIAIFVQNPNEFYKNGQNVADFQSGTSVGKLRKNSITFLYCISTQCANEYGNPFQYVSQRKAGFSVVGLKAQVGNGNKYQVITIPKLQSASEA